MRCCLHFSEVTIRVHAAGSGRALAMLSDGTVDLVISHAPETETRYLAEHSRWVYRKIAFNRFLVIGPRDGPGAGPSGHEMPSTRFAAWLGLR